MTTAARGSRARVPPAYPVPQETGGHLIRTVLKSLREDARLSLPLNSDILIAVSGGCDSVALAHVLVKYGRRVVPRTRIHLLHVNHGWRGAESDADAAFVEELARAWEVPCETVRLPGLAEKPAGRSPEDYARELRKAAYAKHQKKKRLIFTAHHADDLAETVLWRLCTGGFPKLAGGILPCTPDGEVRPFLHVTKAQLQDFLREEGVRWREDRTNHEGELLRTRMRRELMPAVEKLFPAYREALVRTAAEYWAAQKK